MLPNVSFVLGGAASGKSAFAENLIVSSTLPKVYVATAQVLDDEMRDKIKLHTNRRGPGWRVVETAGDLTETLAGCGPNDAILIDCATMWLSNRFGSDETSDPGAAFIRQIENCAGKLVIVSNEVGQGIVPDNALARSFREAQGRLNIAIAAHSDLVVQVVAGLPNVLKGALP